MVSTSFGHTFVSKSLMEKSSSTASMETPATRAESTSFPDNYLSEDPESIESLHTLKGIQYAEVGDWETLISRLEECSDIAQHRDHHGMLPLHWACTDPKISMQVIQALLHAYPQGALARNNAHYFPIHIAVRAGLDASIVRILYEAEPSTLHEKTIAGKTPLMLSREATHSNQDLAVLLEEAQHTNSVQDVEETETSQYHDQVEAKDACRILAPVTHPSRPQTLPIRRSQSHTPVIIPFERQHEPLSVERSTLSAPEEAHQGVKGAACQFCYRKFGLFRRKYICIQCFSPLCRDHIAGKLKMKVSDAKRGVICKECFRGWEGRAFSNGSEYVRGSAVGGCFAAKRGSPEPHNSLIGNQQAWRRSSAYSKRDSSYELPGRRTDCSDSTVIQNQIGALMERNEALSTCVKIQQEQYNEAMLLLRQTLTRVSELEFRLNQCVKPDINGEQQATAIV
uniref:Uncharacterized protein AlNc14C21G2144 n=1 Tax=Albugo laibachii Nc14 TaxID=890382 RepID=F0W5H9_9STRA|nr:conserved hypothetical protein [Albugo laibachii Nc14]|eukprot:CCA16370.1 conserved hypothetical protein [Albugo laibachii Nc14]